MRDGISLRDLEILVGLVASLETARYADPFVRALIDYCKRVYLSGDIKWDLYGH